MKIVKSYRKMGNRARILFWFLALFGVIAVFEPFLANNKPVFCQLNGNTYFPAISGKNLVKSPEGEVIQIADWSELDYDFAVWPLVRHSSYNTDPEAGSYAAPSFRNKNTSSSRSHLMGTDAFGRDVLAGMIRGTRTALEVGLLSMLLAGIIGIIAGLIAGYFGDKGLRMGIFTFGSKCDKSPF